MFSVAFTYRQNSQTLMPPPPVPPKAFSSATTMPVIHRPDEYSSSQSDKWVPSSQSQELAIPRRDGFQDRPLSGTSPLSDKSSRVVPSSQDYEREIISPRRAQIDKVPLERTRLLAPLRTSSFEDVSGGSSDTEIMPSPGVIESSQSQFEAEISASWVERLAGRTTKLQGYVPRRVM